MCRSRSNGGQRCAAHTRPKYQATSMRDPAWDDVAAEYASTKEGEAALLRAAFAAFDTGDFETEARYRNALSRGLDVRAANHEAAQIMARTPDPTVLTPEQAQANLDALLAQTATEMHRNPERFAATFRNWQRSTSYEDLESPDERFRPDPALYADDEDTARALRKVGLERWLAQPLPVFVYGTLRRNQGNDRLMDGAIEERSEEASVSGIAIYGPGRGFPYAKEAPDGQGITRGDLVHLTDDGDGRYARDRLDTLEGFRSDTYNDSHYRRVETTVTYPDPVTGEPRETRAWTYLAGAYHARTLPESERIHDGDWVAARRAHRAGRSTHPTTSSTTGTGTYTGDYVVKKAATTPSTPARTNPAGTSARSSADVFASAGLLDDDFDGIDDAEFEDQAEDAGFRSMLGY